MNKITSLIEDLYTASHYVFVEFLHVKKIQFINECLVEHDYISLSRSSMRVESEHELLWVQLQQILKTKMKKLHAFHFSCKK
jgi:hypothetical protein